jgi:hypothetical protein
MSLVGDVDSWSGKAVWLSCRTVWSSKIVDVQAFQANQVGLQGNLLDFNTQMAAFQTNLVDLQTNLVDLQTIRVDT